MCLILWGVAGWLHAQAVPVPTPVAGYFKTIDGKEYKNATVSHVEPDGLVLRTKSGISKVYFVELPKDVQERFHYDALLCGIATSHSQSPSPSDRVFLTERVPVRTHSGLVSFPPGMALHAVSKSGETSHVTGGTETFDVPNNKLTTDANLAAWLAQNDYAAAEAAAQDSALQMEAYRRVEAIKKAEQDRQIAAARQAQQQQQAEIERQDQAAARQAEQRWEAELQRRRDKEDYIFQQQHKTPDVIIIPQQGFAPYPPF
jgi:hypothetical protein